MLHGSKINLPFLYKGLDVIRFLGLKEEVIKVYWPQRRLSLEQLNMYVLVLFQPLQDANATPQTWYTVVYIIVVFL